MSAQPLDAGGSVPLAAQPSQPGGRRWQSRLRIRAAIPRWVYIALSISGFVLPLIAGSGLRPADGWGRCSCRRHLM